MPRIPDPAAVSRPVHATETWDTDLARVQSDRRPGGLLSFLRSTLRVTLRTGRSHCPDVAVSDLSPLTDVGPIRCRLFRSNPDGPSPLLIFFHGGGFISCDLDTHDEMCRVLARSAGVQLLSVGYSLAPEAPYPRQLEEAIAIGRWALAHAGTLGSEGAYTAVGGDSSGAYLAARVALAMNQSSAGQIRAQLLLYPLVQMDDATWARPTLSLGRVMGRIATRLIRHYLGGAYSSLLTEDLSAAPATMLVTGGPDPTREDTEAFAAALKAIGVTARIKHYPLMPHGGFNLLHLSARARADLTEVGGVLRAMLT
jgi:acetyl esterase